MFKCNGVAAQVPRHGEGDLEMGHDHRHRATSRRRILTALAATAGGVGLLPRIGLRAQPAPTTRRLVDTHHHYYPREIIDAWQGYASRNNEGRLQPNVANWAPAASLEEMDKSGVGTSILSLASIPGVWFGLDASDMRRMSRRCNEFAAKMVQDYPGRYGLFASLPMPDVDGSLAEIAYAFDSLKADGINLSTSFGDRWPGDPAYKPVFEELNRRKAVVFFHPYAPNCCGSLNSGVPPGFLEFPYDSGRAITSLLLSGSLARLRDIRWLFSHGGGVMPMLAGRVAFFTAARKDAAEIAPNGVLAELQRLYYDTANAVWPVSMAGLLKMVPPSQIVFGTDFPYVPTNKQADELEKNGLSPDALAAIQRENATRLIPRLSA
jgi:predicted TIM-barrel fold metal-dependent hydrolase